MEKSGSRRQVTGKQKSGGIYCTDVGEEYGAGGFEQVPFYSIIPIAVVRLFESQGSRICWENLCLSVRAGTSSLGCGTGLKVPLNSFTNELTESFVRVAGKSHLLGEPVPLGSSGDF
ncbi:hypothetical protein WN943_029154 [Citrus x changshan-huyou]